MKNLKSAICLLSISIACAIIYPSPALSQSVSVQNGLGQYGFGWMFGRNGACYIVMPKHVAGPFPRVTISTAGPLETTTATVIAPFWEGMDLALGVARGPLLDRCTMQLEDLSETGAELNAASGDLLRLAPNGEEVRDTVRFADRSYLTFTGTIEAGGTDIAGGTSGAFVFVQGRPMGMAITSDDPTRATFMRSGEILIHLRRFLDEQGGAYVPAVNTAVEPQNVEQSSLPLRFERSSVSPVNPQFAPENMVSDGQFIFRPQRQMSFIFSFDAPTPVSRIVLRSTAAPTQTSPKKIILRWSADKNADRFRDLKRGEMGPDGVFDTGLMAKRNLHHIELIVLDTWSSGDVVIDDITAY